MKSTRLKPSDYLELVEAIYIDASTKCSADVFDLRDLETIRSRVKHEGISFLTITLPQFARDFERSLANCKVDSAFFRGFDRVKNVAIPAFLQGMLSRVFDRKTGEMFDDKSSSPFGDAASDIPTIIESVRQICLTFKKLEVACSPKRIQAALDSFVSIEQSFHSFLVPQEEQSKFLAVSSLLWDNLVSDFSVTKCIPKHGPGATAERVSGNRKFTWLFWHDRLEPYFPLIDNGYPLGIPADEAELDLVTMVPADMEQPVRVTPVPKTLKGPRIIAIEPCCTMFVQQGIRDYLYGKIEKYWLTRGHVNFTDQSVNQQLAISSSMTGQFATIDLSDASDRVPRSLALEMFRSNPELQDAIDACRSTMAQLPDGRLVGPLMKFASMGSALCFPVEAMYFYTVCVMALLDASDLSYEPRNVFNVTRGLYVYGDDIVVPCTKADIVLDYLRKYNCKVNVNKTFVSGSFRESCGIDAFDGYQVTPVYLTQERPENKQQASRLISWVAAANHFYKKGYWRTTQLLTDCVEMILGNLPYVSETSEALGRISFLGYESIERWNPNLQRFEINAYVPRPVNRTDLLWGFGALMKCFLAPGRPPWVVTRKGNITTVDFPDSQGSLSLEQSARHGAVALKRRWVQSH